MVEFFVEDHLLLGDQRDTLFDHEKSRGVAGLGRQKLHGECGWSTSLSIGDGVGVPMEMKNLTLGPSLSEKPMKGGIAETGVPPAAKPE